MFSRLTTADLIFLEVAPPGREPQVRKLKGKVDNPYAVAWASYNKQEGGPGSGRHPYGTGQRGQDAAKMHAFLKKYPKQWHSLAKDVRTQKAFSHLKSLYPKNIIHSPNTGQMRYEANSSGGLPQTLRGQKQAKTMCGMTDWGKGALGMKQADKSILKSLLNESVESKSYRFSESNLMEVVAPVMPASAEAMQPQEGPVVKCVLITEGLGNRADMHYYGPECIKNGVPLFEGQPCFVDHQKRSEQQDQPERTVRDKCGYFKNVRAEMVEGRLGIVGELHYDLSETGRYAYDKACTAIHYKTEFPGSSKEYVGLSIAADGKLEERVMQVGDEVLDVKYVTEFTAVGSVDEVTSPARGGRFVQVLSR